jgi:hypothetical protein
VPPITKRRQKEISMSKSLDEILALAEELKTKHGLLNETKYNEVVNLLTTHRIPGYMKSEPGLSLLKMSSAFLSEPSAHQELIKILRFLDNCKDADIKLPGLTE